MAENMDTGPLGAEVSSGGLATPQDEGALQPSNVTGLANPGEQLLTLHDNAVASGMDEQQIVALTEGLSNPTGQQQPG